MGGGPMQLVAYGAQDVYLTGNPQITFWKVTYADILILLWKVSNRLSMPGRFGRRVTCTIHVMVILLTELIFRLLSLRLTSSSMPLFRTARS